MKVVQTRTAVGLVAIVALATTLVFAQNDSASDTEQNGPLVVTGIVLSQKCHDWNKDVAELELRFQFTNRGDKPLILNIRDITTIGAKYFAFIDEGKDEVHLGQTATCSLRGYSPEYDKELVSNYPNSNFVVLSPGQSYALESTEAVPLIASTTSSDLNGDKLDNYQVEIEIATWYTMDPKLADKLQRKWKNVGVVWSKSLWSEPFEFTFERKRTCEE